jgi:hypothetical protein
VKFTLMQVEMDGNDAGAILRGLTEAVQGREGMAVPEPVVERARVLALPEPKKRAYHKAAKVQTAQVKEPKTITGGIRDAIADGPKSNAEVLAYVLAEGLEADSAAIAKMCCQLRARNEIYKGDGDLKWHKAITPTKR